MLSENISQTVKKRPGINERGRLKLVWVMISDRSWKETVRLQRGVNHPIQLGGGGHWNERGKWGKTVPGLVSVVVHPGERLEKARQAIAKKKPAYDEHPPHGAISWARTSVRKSEMAPTRNHGDD